ncbi:DUF2971 domain-containing protein [Vibrio vulnificus]|nr:DUF2971 domain-containing protein [Vibrio vulnificus]
MTKFLYKYMPLRKEFFDNFMIRATPVMALNDPFEGFFNERQVEDADHQQREYYRSLGKDVFEKHDGMVEDLMGTIQADFFDLGILSFTEDHNNPLMWAHYANDHKGVVVEFNLNEPLFDDSLQYQDGRRNRFGKCYLGDVFEFPEKVSYRRQLPSFDRPELSAPDSENQYHWIKFNREILFTKSEDWIYEKEHRSVVQLHDADSIICPENEHIRKICSYDKSIKVETLGNGKIQVIYPREYEMHEEMGDESIKKEVYRESMDYGEPAIHLFRLNPNSISRIYFGCKSDYFDIAKSISEDDKLRKLDGLYKMEHSKKYYHLDSKKI